MERTLNFPACNPLEKILLLLLFLLFFFHCWQFTSVHASKRCPCCTPPPPQPSRYMVHATHTFLGGKLGHYFTRRGFTHARAHTHGLVLFASTFSIRYSCSRAQPMCSRVWSHMSLALYRPNKGEGPCRGKRMTPLPFQPIVDNVRIGTWQNLPWISAPYVRCFINTGCVLLIQTALWIQAVLYEYGLYFMNTGCALWLQPQVWAARCSVCDVPGHQCTSHPVSSGVPVWSDVRLRRRPFANVRKHFQTYSDFFSVRHKR